MYHRALFLTVIILIKTMTDKTSGMNWHCVLNMHLRINLYLYESNDMVTGSCLYL